MHLICFYELARGVGGRKLRGGCHSLQLSSDSYIVDGIKIPCSNNYPGDGLQHSFKTMSLEFINSSLTGKLTCTTVLGSRARRPVPILIVV